jgi:tetratricopeptide (TPR) repeat protein
VWAVLGVVGIVGGAVLWQVALAEPPKPPEAGLSALERYRNPRGADVSLLESASLWEAAARDFAVAAEQSGAPERWKAAALLAEAKAAMAREEVQAALPKLQQALELDPAWSLPHIALCGAYARLGKLDEALSHAAEAQRLEPKFWRAISAGAAANAYANKLEQAVEEYRRALELAPEHPLLLSDLALVYHAMHVDSEAKSLANRALELDPDLVSPRIMLAERALERDDYEAALQQASKAIAVLPRSIPARLAQAEAMLGLGQLPESRAAFTRAQELWESGGKQGPFEPRLEAVRAALDGAEATPGSATARSSAADAPSEAVATPRTPTPSPPRSPTRRSPVKRSPVKGKPKKPTRSASKSPGSVDVGF